MKLQTQWDMRIKLRAEGRKLYAEGNKLRAEGNKLYAEFDKMYAEGDIAWFTAVIKEYGNITVKWDGQSCILPNRDRYEA